MDRDVEPAYRNAALIGDEDDLIGTPVEAREASDDVARRRGIAELHGKGGDRIRVVRRHGADCHGTVAATDSERRLPQFHDNGDQAPLASSADGEDEAGVDVLAL